MLDKLLDLATDRYDKAVERVDAVQALDILIPVLPGATMLHVAQRLMVLAHDPEFGFQDDAEIYGRDPLRGIRMNLGGRNLASRALYTAIQAYRRAVTGDPALADAELAVDMLLAGETMLRSDDDAEAEAAADGLAVLSGLAADPSALVRRRVAQFASTVLTRLGPAAAEPILEQLRADRAWSVRYHLTRSLTQPTGGRCKKTSS